MKTGVRFRLIRKRIRFLLASYATRLRIGRYFGVLGFILGFGIFCLASYAITSAAIVLPKSWRLDSSSTVNFDNPTARVDAWRNFLLKKDLRMVEIVAFSTSQTPRCLDIKKEDDSHSIADSEALQLWSCSQQDNQKWVLYRDASIRSLVNGMQSCLDVEKGEAVMTHCSQHISKWSFDSGSHQIRLNDSPKCLQANSNKNGSPVEIVECESPPSENQRYILL
mmetsp:Transcript_32097/g.51672  ORF Transcript_32097/g.51672 Transcript_32097/m.51672 type:complete len:223 (-) Transcript_32097:309-977(-)